MPTEHYVTVTLCVNKRQVVLCAQLDQLVEFVHFCVCLCSLHTDVLHNKYTGRIKLHKPLSALLFLVSVR